MARLILSRNCPGSTNGKQKRMKDYELKLLPAEKLFHWRRKKKMTQGQLAKKLKVHQATVSKMEKGLIPVTTEVRRLVRDVKVLPGERCAILRRRFGRTLRNASLATGIHQHRLSEMERGLLRKVDPRYVAWIETLLDG